MTKIKVGIVENDMIIAQGIADALTQLGYAATEPAVSYTEALEMIARERPDILLLDIRLSGRKDGIDLAWKIREDYNLPLFFLPPTQIGVLWKERKSCARPPTL